MRADPRLSACAALLLGVLTACSGAAGDATTDSPASPAPSPSVVTADLHYAALGDSYSAAPFVPQTDLAGGCFRSSGNYPSLVADDLGIVDVTDVTCSGAETADVAGRQVVAGGEGTVPPQIRAVTRDTDLVTIGIGGNDENLFATLVHQCTTTPAGATPCLDLLGSAGSAASDVIRRTSQRVVGVLRLVHRKAPDAQVVLVGYPRLVDPDRPCAKIPIEAAQLPRVAAFEKELRDGLAAAARKGDAQLVDMYALSRGHEICSADPWVNGKVTDQTRALAYHPFAVEQRAVATQVDRIVLEDS